MENICRLAQRTDKRFSNGFPNKDPKTFAIKFGLLLKTIDIGPGLIDTFGLVIDPHTEVV